MQVKLIKKFGKHESGTEIEANDILLKHLNAGNYIGEYKPKPGLAPESGTSDGLAPASGSGHKAKKRRVVSTPK